ncbi:hypothetical protein BS78_03G125400 [Paspalum vaginatum]|nr:hypothetical protein BS78_03G125400 [Paspalum vaginatum]
MRELKLSSAICTAQALGTAQNSSQSNIGCWIFYGSGVKTSIQCLGSETAGVYNSFDEVANPCILFVILASLSCKRNGLIHDTMIGRCNGILIVPISFLCSVVKIFWGFVIF